MDKPQTRKEQHVKIILPKTLREIDPNYGPLFFLAGPVRGGGDWQKRCCEEIRELLPKFYAAIPYYHNSEVRFPLMEHAERGLPNAFPRQLNWERYYMLEAAKFGCLIFFLPEESKTEPRPSDAGPYATDTRGEIARWSVELKYNHHYRLVVGVEPGFVGLDQIKRNFDLDQGYKFPFRTSLEDVAKDAVQKAADAIHFRTRK